MGLFRSLVLIERKLYDGESVESYQNTKHRKVALVLDEYKDEVLVATFSKFNSDLNKTYVIYASKNERLFFDIQFDNMIYLIPKTSIVGKPLAKLPMDIISGFMLRLRADKLINKSHEDYLALLNVFEFYNKRFISPGSVISVLNEEKYEVYFVDDVEENYIKVYRLKYEAEVGLSLSSFEPMKLPYNICLLDYVNFGELEERIRNIINENTLKLISGRGLKK